MAHSLSLRSEHSTHAGGWTRVRGRHPIGHRLQAALAASVLLLAGCVSRPAPAPVAPQVVAVAAQAVRRAEIQQTVTANGDVRARGQVPLLSKATGRVLSVNVDVGSTVHAGDVLVQLDADAAAQQVLQAQAAVTAAQAKLAQVQQGGREDDIAAAQAQVAAQQAKLASMQGGGRLEDVAIAEANLQVQQAKLIAMQSGGRPELIQQAQAQLDGAEAKLNMVDVGATEDVRQGAQSQVDADRVAATASDAAVAAFDKGGAVDLQAATSAVEAAKAQLATAEAARHAFDASSAADLQAVQSALDAATSQLAVAQAALKAKDGTLQLQMDKAQAAQDRAQAAIDRTTALQTIVNSTVGLGSGGTVQIGPCMLQTGATAPTDPNICDSAKNAAASSVTAAQALKTAADDAKSLAQNAGDQLLATQFQAAVDEANAQVKAVQARLNALKGGIQDAQRTQLDGQVTAAREALKVAQARLDALKGGAAEGQHQALIAQQAAAHEKLKADLAKLDAVLAGPRPEERTQAESAVEVARQQLAVAQQPATEIDIATQKGLVEQATQQLAKARAPFTAQDIEQQKQVVAAAAATLRKSTSPFTDTDIQAAQAAFDQANAQLQIALQNQQELTVVAPVDGVIADRLVSPGTLVSPTTPLLALVPPSLEVVASLGDGVVSQLAAGQSVRLQVASLPNQSLTGTVTTIVPTIDVKTRLAGVRVQPDGDSAAKLRPGMFAKLNIVVATKSDALVVPREALPAAVAPGSRATVMLIEPGSDGSSSAHTHKQSIRVGLVNDQMVEVTSGLTEGQMVATSGLNDLSDGDVVAPKTDRVTALAN